MLSFLKPTRNNISRKEKGDFQKYSLICNCYIDEYNICCYAVFSYLACIDLPIKLYEGQYNYT